MAHRSRRTSLEQTTPAHAVCRVTSAPLSALPRAVSRVLTSTDSKEEGGILGFEMHSDGAGYCNLQLPYDQKDKAVGPDHHVIEGEYKPIGMNGKEVYKFATREVPEVIEEALANAGLTTDDVDHLLLHQVSLM